MITGIVKGYEVKKNRDGAGARLMLQVEITDPDDIQTVELMSASGEDNVPPIDSRVLIVSVGSAYKIGIAIDDGITPSMSDGEKKMYSIASGAISAFINLLNTGIIELNGNADFAVRYNALETAFDELKTDFNNFVTTVYNVHNHPTAPTGPVSPPSATGSSSAADITGAKIDEIKVP